VPIRLTEIRGRLIWRLLYFGAGASWVYALFFAGRAAKVSPGAHHTHYLAELGIACLTEGLIWALPVQFGFLGYLAYAVRLGHIDSGN